MIKKGGVAQIGIKVRRAYISTLLMTKLFLQKRYQVDMAMNIGLRCPLVSEDDTGMRNGTTIENPKNLPGKMITLMNKMNLIHHTTQV